MNPFKDLCRGLKNAARTFLLFSALFAQGMPSSGGGPDQTKRSVPVSETSKLDKTENGNHGGFLPGRVSTLVKTVGGVLVVCGNFKDASGKLVLPQTCITMAPPPPSPTPSASPSATPTPSSPPTPSGSGSGWYASAISPDGKTIYYGERKSNRTFIFDIPSKTKKQITVSEQLRNIYASPDGRHVIFHDCDFWAVLDTKSLAVRRVDYPPPQIPSSKPSQCDDPKSWGGQQLIHPMVFFSPNGSKAFLTPSLLLDLNSLKLTVTSARISNYDNYPVFSPDSSVAYFTTGGNQVVALDLKSGVETRTRIQKPASGPMWATALALDATGSKLYFSGQTGYLGVIDLKTKVQKWIDTSRYPEYEYGKTNGKSHQVSLFVLPAGRIFAAAYFWPPGSFFRNMVSIDPQTDSIGFQNKDICGGYCAPPLDTAEYILPSKDGTKVFYFLNQSQFIRLDTLTYHVIGFRSPEAAALATERRPDDGSKFLREAIVQIPSPDGKQFHILFDDDAFVSFPIP